MGQRVLEWLDVRVGCVNNWRCYICRTQAAKGGGMRMLSLDVWELFMRLNASGLLQALTQLQAWYQTLSNFRQGMRDRPYEVGITAAQLAEMKESARVIATECTNLDLASTKAAATRLVAIFGRIDPDIKTQEGSILFDAQSQHSFDGAFHEISGRIRDDLALTETLVVNPGDAALYTQKSPSWGAEVAARFNSIEEDISEAGKCLALERYTACVFHLMRALEVVVQEFASSLGVKLADVNGKQKMWQNLLDEINKAVKGLDQRDPLTTRKAGASALLENVKLAWRNPVMHPKKTYTEEEARSVYEASRTLTRDLATFL